jgi:hypothetical protein
MGTYVCTVATGYKNSSVSVEDYNGTLSINSTWEGEKGTKDNWIYESKWENGESRAGERRPLRIRLSNPATSIRILQQMIDAIKKKYPEDLAVDQKHPVTGDKMPAANTAPPNQKPQDDDIPF